MIPDPLLQAFERRLARAPDDPLLISSGNSASAATLESIARRAAQDEALSKLRPGDAAALVATNGAGFLGLLLGLRRTGATVVLFDRHSTPTEIARAARRFPIRLVARCETAWPDSDAAWSLESLPAADADGGDAPSPLDPRIAVIKLTSGSTGEPRGAATPSAALLADHEALTASMAITPADRLLATLPFSHSYGLSSLVVPALVGSNALVLPAGSGPFAPLQAARELDASIFPTVPAYLEGMLRAGVHRDALQPLRRVIVAGARLLPDTAARFRHHFGRPAHVFYGASECGGITYDREGDAGERDEVGQPVEGVRIELEPVPGTIEAPGGRVVVQSAAVGAGYLPDPDPRLTPGRFVTDDLATFHGDRLRLVGRLSGLINVRGKKVNPAEIEAVIADRPGVEEVRVLGCPGAGSAGDTVQAFVACRPGAVSEEDLRNWCIPRLTDFKVPRRFVLLERLPHTERGKVDRLALQRLQRAGTGRRDA